MCPAILQQTVVRSFLFVTNFEHEQDVQFLVTFKYGEPLSCKCSGDKFLHAVSQLKPAGIF